MLSKEKGIILSAFLTLIILTGLYGCKERTKGNYEGVLAVVEKCTEYSFQIDSLPYSELHNTGFKDMPAVDTSKPHDSAGVVLFQLDGEETYYHPVLMCRYASKFTDLYIHTGEKKYYDILMKYLDRFRIMAVAIDSAVFFPYHINHYVHGDHKMPLVSPWYSGMAQGTILGLYSRVFTATGDSTYLHYADSIFNSLLPLRGEADPWVVFIDSAGCFWIEEYPIDPPTKTLNGFIFALYGVYDYYQLTKNPEAERILQQGLSTVKNYLPVYRIKGASSLYELRSPYFDLGYHYVHIKQLKHLYRLTGDEFFAAWADSLASDVEE